MQILFDLRHVSISHSGLARYAENMLFGLLRSRLDAELTVFVPPGYQIPVPFEGKRVRAVTTEIPLWGLRHHTRMARLVDRFPDSVYFFPNFDPPFLAKTLTVFVVHDLLALRVPGYIQKRRAPHLFYFKECIRLNLLRENRKCVAVSRATRDDILELVSKKSRHPLQVAHEASFLQDRYPRPSRPIEELVSKSNYLLYVGDRRPHKNLRKMTDIFLKMVAQGYPGRFLIVGKKEVFDFDVETYAGGRPEIVVLPPVDDADLFHLYAHCEALLFLTKYEGFGLPILEAAQLGRKIVTSSVGGAREIAPKGCLLLDPGIEPAEAALRIEDYLGNPRRPDPLAVKQAFDWKKSAEEVFAPYCT